MTATMVSQIDTANIVNNAIRIRGARTHNLQNIDVDVPLGKLVVVTGVSGSGKSSLAFDTLFAEGQRRYLESVSVHTRSLLKQFPRPDVDEVSGLPPTVSVDQRVTAAPARSTLAATTEIYDFLRLLYAKAGVAHCTNCGKPVHSQTVAEVVRQVLQRPERTKLMVLSPMVHGRRGAHKDILERIGRNGFVRVRVDGELLDISDVPELSSRKQHDVDAVIDRIILKDGIEQRLRESIDLAVRESDGTCIVCEQVGGAWQDQLFSTKFSCADCNLSFPTPEPRTFSFNSAWGACEKCEGFGVQGIVEETQDIAVFRKAPCDACGGSRLQPFARNFTFRDRSIADFTSLSVNDALELVRAWEQDTEHSTGETQYGTLVAARTLPDIRQRLECLQKVGVGYLTLSRATRTLSGGEFQRARLAACLGTGLHGACFVLDEPTSGLHPRDTQRLLATLCEIRDAGATVVVVEHDGEVMRAADHLIDLGPGAGIEGGRLVAAAAPNNVATASNSPTAKYLRGEGVVDEDCSGSFMKPQQVPAANVKERQQTTQQQLFPDDASAGAAGEAKAETQLTIRKARRNNLQNITVDIPLQKLICVTGVSGSGKSSLIMETLLPVATAFVRKDADSAFALADADCDAIDGLDAFGRVVAVDSSPLSRNRRSCIATYSKLWNDVRKIFARTKTARAKGYDARRFSFNSGDGRCGECKGTGLKDVRMAFLPNATVPCPECLGKRFNAATLAVRFADKNVADVLDMRIDEAVEFFGELQSLRSMLETFRSVGLGYLALGQPASTFSGGEAQRVKLATELAGGRSEPTLFILDEPTAGLHPADVEHLIRLLRSLITAGHSVIVVEHNVDIMNASDWIIDIGPESAMDGGQVVGSGTPADLAEAAVGLTAGFLSVAT